MFLYLQAENLVFQSAEVDEDMAKDVTKGVSLPFVVVNAICGSLIAIGCILLAVGIIKVFRLRVS